MLLSLSLSLSLSLTRTHTHTHTHTHVQWESGTELAIQHVQLTRHLKQELTPAWHTNLANK